MSTKFRYTVHIIPESDGMGYYVVVPSLPGCFSQGKTVEEAREKISGAIALHIRSLKKSGEPIPSETTESYKAIVEVAA